MGDFKFVELLKTERTYNHKTNDVSVNKIEYKFETKLCAVDGSDCAQLMGVIVRS